MDKMKELVDLLNNARDAYYSKNEEIISNLEYDSLFDQLVSMEQETGIVLSGSPTMSVGYTSDSSGLKKLLHEIPALSLDKTKDINELKRWLGNKPGVLSWKLDGLTVQATYLNGRLSLALTRGNGEVGEDITENAGLFIGLPLEIPCMDKIIVRGEAAITYSEFDRINNTIFNLDNKYKNPRNLASGTVRALDSSLLKERSVIFTAFQLVLAPIKESINNFSEQLRILSEWGFNCVNFTTVNTESLESEIKRLESGIENISKSVNFNIPEIPVDGLVLTFEDVAFGESLGSTGHHARSGMAFKFTDEEKETTVREIFWSPSKTGLINPVAIFDPVELEGTTVRRASVHNVSILKQLGCGVGAKISVYKANMIIPQVARTLEKANVIIPDICPVCGKPTSLKDGKNGSAFLYCGNPDCEIKQIKRFVRFCERNAMNIDGISEATLEALIAKTFVKKLSDLYVIDNFKAEIVIMDGFGEKSYQNMIKSIENSKKVKMSNFLYSLGIHNFGKDASKIVSKNMKMDEFIHNLDSNYSFAQLDGIGEIIEQSLRGWWNKADNKEEFYDLLKVLNIEEEIKSCDEGKYNNLTFVITGTVNNFTNRDELKAFIEENGGKVSGSVSKNTSYLINNDTTSTSGKNKKAQELGISIISEENFMNL